MDAVARERRRLHNEEVYDLYSSPNLVHLIKSRRTIWAGHVERMEDRRGSYGVLVGKPDGARPLSIPRRIWEIVLKCIFKEWDGV
jgi:hypothetical protein